MLLITAGAATSGERNCLAMVTLVANPAADQADAAFLDGDYQRALNGYLQLYARTQDPIYLHNSAGCYEKLGNTEKAIEYFSRYLRDARDLDAGTRAEVERTIERLRVASERLRVASERLRAAPATEPPPPPPVAPATNFAAPPAPVVIPPPPPPPSSPAPPPSLGIASVEARHSEPAAGMPLEKFLRRAAVVEAGLGVAAVGLGVYFGVRARNLERQVSEATVFDADVDRQGQRANALQYSMYAVGGALLVGSGAFFYCSYWAGRDTGRVAVVPSVGPNQAGTLLAARF